jgi:hypothetical protein
MDICNMKNSGGQVLIADRRQEYNKLQLPVRKIGKAWRRLDGF